MTTHMDMNTKAKMRALRLGVGAAGFNCLPIYFADRQGLFAREGLEIEIRRMGSVEKTTAAVKSGELDIAITPPEGAIRDGAADGELLSKAHTTLDDRVSSGRTRVTRWNIALAQTNRPGMGVFWS